MGHNYRTYAFGRVLVPEDLDEEVSFVASMLHDIGLVDEHLGTTSFEVVGAEVAARFLESCGWPLDRIRLVEQAIVRHVELVPLAIPELRLVQAGAALDVAGLPTEALDLPEVVDIVLKHPRGSTAKDLRELVLAEIARQPDGVFARLEGQVQLSTLLNRNPLDARR
jgi:hypothetical protein